MAVIIDERAQEIIAHRRAQGRDVAITLHVVPLRGMQSMLRVAWAPWHGGGSAAGWVYVSPRIARYARWHDVVISAWHLGPFERLAVADEPRVMLEMVEWEAAHPGLRQTACKTAASP
ncbi:MAG TPA: hypothetical protein VFE42_15395 [Chloroflexota bacterium]|nr:hypothetical protein [Chloroflexota bacterium]